MTKGRKGSQSSSIFLPRKSTLLWIILTICLLYGIHLLRSTNSRTVNLKELLSVSIEAARRGGYEVKKVREKADIGEKSKGETHEGANNPVTDGDMLSHRAMYNGILKAFPNIHIVSEESDPKPYDLDKIQMPPLRNTEVEEIISDGFYDIPIEDIDVWIDPLDATQEYTENLNKYVTTMVCVAIKGKPVLGVIYKPFEDVLVWGWAEDVNKVNHVLREDFLKSKLGNSSKNNRFIVSRSHAGDVDQTAKKVFGQDTVTTPAGGAGYKVLEVIKGHQDAYIHVTLIKKWDICPGNALLRALGGNLTTLKGEEVNYSDKDEKNKGGVLAALHDHDRYVRAFREYKNP
uniref:Putative inositol monophosphatase 3 n=1 Tax=Lepeophtheirus salmonis TaxID=72036 RepID=A0A0K2SYR5_LEPSM